MELIEPVVTKIEDFYKWEAFSRDSINVKRIYIDLAGDLIAGILLSQIVFWHLPDKERKYPTKLRVEKDGNLWLVKKREEWWDECRITRKQFDRAINVLKDKGIVETKLYKFNGAPQVHIRINEEAFIQRVKWIFTKGENPNSLKGKMDIDEREKSLTEITTETITYTFPSPLPSSQKIPSEKSVNGSPKGKKGKGNIDRNLFERLRSGIYRNDLFAMYDNLLRIRSIEELAGDAAYKAIKSVLHNNEEFLRQEYGTNYSKFPKDETSEVVAKRFPYDKLPDSSDEDARRNFFVSAVCNTVAEVMAEALEIKKER